MVGLTNTATMKDEIEHIVRWVIDNRYSNNEKKKINQLLPDSDLRCRECGKGFDHGEVCSLCND